MKHELWYSVVVRDRHGKVISREHRKSRSFLKAWNELMFAQVTAKTGVSGTQIKGIDGVTQNAYPEARNFRVESHGSYTGIWCGTGDTAVAIDDYILEALIAEGAGPGQFNYSGMATVTAASVSDSHCQFGVSRSPVNNSGNPITVKEVGIYTSFYVSTTQKFMCAIRDVLETPQEVPAGGAITVDYTLEVVA